MVNELIQVKAKCYDLIEQNQAIRAEIHGFISKLGDVLDIDLGEASNLDQVIEIIDENDVSV